MLLTMLIFPDWILSNIMISQYQTEHFYILQGVELVCLIMVIQLDIFYAWKIVIKFYNKSFSHTHIRNYMLNKNNILPIIPKTPFK